MCWREKTYSLRHLSVRETEQCCWTLSLASAQWVNITFLWRPNLPDESDNHLIELAVAGNAEWIITGNTKDIAAGELVFDSFRIVTPGIWLKEDDEHGNTNNPNS